MNYSSVFQNTLPVKYFGLKKDKIVKVTLSLGLIN
jgi:hypothetical protein